MRIHGASKSVDIKYGHFKDIRVKAGIVVLLLPSFDGIKIDEMAVRQIVKGPPKYHGWDCRN